MERGILFPLCATNVSEHGDLCHIWAQVDFNAYDQLTELMASFVYTPDLQQKHVEPGTMCIAKFEDDAWYRAEVKTVDAATRKAKLHFIDYGNSATVAFNDIAKPLPKYFTLPPLAFKFTLADIAPSHNQWSASEIQVLNELMSNTEYVGQVLQEARGTVPAVVRLFTDQSQSQVVVRSLVQQGIGKPLNMIIQPRPQTVIGLQPGSQYKVAVSFADSPLNFWVQLVENIGVLEQLHEAVAADFQNSAQPTSAESGKVCLALYAEMQTYYRAVIDNAVSPSKYNVSFMDYGNSDAVEANQIMQLPDKYCALPVQAVHCSLQGSALLGSPDEFEKFIEQEELVIRVLAVLPHGLHIVDIVSSPPVKRPEVVAAPTQPMSNGMDTVQDYQPVDVDMSTSREVCISQVHPTGSFHCQFIDQAHKLDALMKPLQSSERYPLTTPSVGLPCVALSPHDNVFYRTRILRVEGPMASVELVDFGQVESLNASCLFCITASEMTLPAQAVLCTIHNGQTLSADQLVKVLTRYQARTALNATIRKTTKTGYEVDLVDMSSGRGINIADMVVEAATPKLSSKPAMDPAQSKSSKVVHPVATAVEIPSPDISLQSNEKLIITNVISDTRIFGQLSRYSAEELESLSTKLQAFYSSQARPGLSSIRPGSACCVQFSEDELFYRAKVVKQVDRDMWEVIFVDYGNSENKDASELLKLQAEFAVLPAQGIMCSLADNYESTTFSMLEQFIDSEVTVTIMRASPSFYEVTLPNVPGNEDAAKLKRKSTTLQVMDISPNACFQVVVSHLESPGEIYCQQVDEQNKLTTLMASLAKYAAEQSSAPKQMSVGDAVIAKYSADEEWYRATVTRMDGAKAVEVKFVDFGNTEVVQLTHIRPIGREQLSLPCMAIPCHMAGWVKTQPFNADQLWATLDGNVKVNVHSFDSKLSSYSVTFYNGSKNLNSAFVPQEKTEPARSVRSHSASEVNKLDSSQTNRFQKSHDIQGAGDSQVCTGLKQLDLLKNKYQDWQISYIVSPDLFWCQSMGNIPALDAMMDELTKLSKGQPQLTAISSGQMCSAQFSEDEVSWYRAQIMSCNAQQVMVKFVDYGNKEEKDAATLRVLHTKFLEMPAQAFQCRLAGCQPVGKEWSPEAIAKFEEITMDKKLFGAVIDAHEGNYGVEIVAEGLLVHEELVNAGLAAELVEGQPQVLTKSSVKSLHPAKRSSVDSSSTHSSKSDPAELVFQNLKVNSGEYHDVSVVYSESPSRFWCQLTKHSSALEQLMEQLNEANNNAPKENLQKFGCGQPCCCLYSDGNWYRSVISAVEGSRVKVQFVDYGNEDWYDKKEILKLSRTFFDLPVQAIQCSLANVQMEGSDDWSDQAKEKFEEMTADKSLVAKVLKSEAGSYITEIVDPSTKPETVLHKCFMSTGRTSKTESQSSPPVSKQKPQQSDEAEIEWRPFTQVELAEDSIHKAVASWVNSPSDFYVQLQEAEKELERLSKELYDFYHGVRLKDLTIKSPEIGQSCVAYYEADGSWYRSTLLSLSGNEAVVRYIDYGNTETVPFQKVKHIVPEFAILPAHAFHCSLLGSSAKKQEWTAAECQKFSKLMWGSLQCQVKGCEDGVCVMDVTTADGVLLAQQMALLKMPEVFSPTQPSKPLKSILKVKSPPQSGSMSSTPEPEAQPRSLEFNIASQTDSDRSQLKLGSEVSLTISNVTDMTNFDCQLVNSTSDLESFQEELEAAYSSADSSRNVPTLEVGLLCCAKDTDNFWYRARVVDIISDTEASVQFIDYGNTANVKISLIQPLLPKFAAKPAYAFQCALPGVQGLPPEALGKFRELAVDKELKAKVVNKVDGKHIIDITCAESGNITQKLLALFPQTSPPEPEKLVLEAIYISTVESPAAFYVQRDAHSIELAEMEVTLAEEYSSLSDGEKSLETVDCGVICCAKSSDEAWYRAKITEVTEDSFQVLFVDYGNMEEVSRADLRSLSPEVAAREPMATKCSLRKCKDPSLITEEDTNKFSELVGVGEKCLQAKFWSPDEVSLFENGEEICQEFTSSDCFLKPKPREGNASVYVTHVDSPGRVWLQFADEAESLETMTETLQTAADTEGPLKRVDVGSAASCVFSQDEAWYRAEVISISDDRATVRYVDFGNTEEVAVTSLYQLSSKLLQDPPFAVLCHVKGLQFEDTCSEEEKARFETLVLDHELTACFTPQSASEPLLVELKNEEKAIAEEFQTVTDEAALPDSTVEAGAVSSVSEVYQSTQVAAGRHQVIVSHIEAVTELYLQLSRDTVVLEQLVDSMDEFYNSAGDEEHPLENPRPGIPCCAKQAGIWYRARVVEIHKENTITVQFVDYGNSETQAAEAIHALMPQFNESPCLAFCCSLLGATSEDVSDEVTDKLDEMVTDKILTAEVAYIDGKCHVTLWNKDELLNSSIVSGFSEDLMQKQGQDVENNNAEDEPLPSEPENLETVEVEPEKEDLADVEPEEVEAQKAEEDDVENTGLSEVTPAATESLAATATSLSASSEFRVGSKLKVKVTHVETPSRFWCRKVSWQPFTDRMSEQLGVERSAVEDLTVGLLVEARYSDGEWYRGQVESVEGNTVSVHFIDYGNSGEVDRADISALASEVSSIPALCRACSLSGVAPTEWTDEALEMFEGLVMEKTLLLEVICEKDDEFVVSLRDMGISISDKLVEAGHATAVSAPSKVLDRSVLEDNNAVISEHKLVVDQIIGGKREVYVSHVESLQAVWVQMKDEGDALSKMDDKMQEYYGSRSTDGVDGIKGRCYAVRSDDDERWYRAQVTDCSEDGYKVRFIDYGNEGCVEAARIEVLGEEFCEVARFAVCCALHTSLEDNDEVRDMFHEATGDKCLLMEVVEFVEEKPSICLRDMGMSVAEKIARELGKECPHVDEELATLLPRYRRLEVAVGETVEMTVSRANSPGDFWCQPARSSLSQLNHLNQQINDFYSAQDTVVSLLEHPSQGQHCVARDADKESWYRAVVTNVSEHGVEVCFVDYGNFEMVPNWEVKEMKPEFTELEVQGMRCRLDGVAPEGGGAMWNEASCGRFAELVGEGKVLKVEVLKRCEDSGSVLAAVPVILTDGEVDISEQLINEGLAQLTQGDEEPSLDESQPSQDTSARVEKLVEEIIRSARKTVEAGESRRVEHIVLDRDAEVKVVHITGESAERFGVHSVYTVPELEELMDEMQAVRGDGVEGGHSPVEQGDCCLVWSQPDALWYRGELTHLDQLTAQVDLLDYGRQVTVPVECVDALPRSFADLKAQIVWCCLQPDDRPVFKDLIAGGDFVLRVLDHDQSGVHRVSVVHSGDDINDYMVQHMLDVSLNASLHADDIEDNLQSSDDEQPDLNEVNKMPGTEIEVTVPENEPDMDKENHDPLTEANDPEQEKLKEPKAEEELGSESEVVDDKPKETEIEDTVATSQPPVEETSETQVDGTSQPEVDETSQPKVDETSQPEVEETSKTQVDETRETQVDETSETQVDETNETQVDETSETQVDETSETQVDETSETQVDETRETQVDETSQPEVEETSEPEVDETSQPEVEETSEPEVDETSQPEVDETSQPEVDETSQPEVDETSQPEVDETSQPEVDETSQPKVDESSQQEVDESSQPEVDETSQPEVDETSQPEVDETSQAEVSEDITSEDDEKVIGNESVDLRYDDDMSTDQIEELENSFLEESIQHRDSLGDLGEHEHIHFTEGSVYSSVEYEVGQEVEVIIKSARDPSHIVCHATSSLPDLALLQESIQASIPDDDVRVLNEPEVGQACCAQFLDVGWARGLILPSPDQDEHLLVRSVDYAVNEFINKDRIQWLSAELLSLPAQALICCLQPLEGRPSPPEDARIDVESLSQPLTATIISFCPDTNTYCVTLKDSAGRDLRELMFTGPPSDKPSGDLSD